MKHLNSKGFTLVELLAVLLLMTVLITISTAFVYRSLQADEEMAFKQQLTKDLLQAHLLAVTSKEHISVYFYQTPSTYIIRSSSNSNYLLKRDLPSTVKVLPTSTLTTFRFLPTGSTSSFGVIRFSVNNEPYSIHYYLGKGRFYVEG